jgi:hypothetical protein
MRKHHTRWVALFSAAAISTTGLAGLAGPASADDKDVQALSWPVVRQGETTYSIDGYEIAYLPAGLERYGVNATSTTDRQGNSQSQLSWVQGPDQLYGRVAVLRSERLQGLDDLREGRYGHLAESSLEELEADETFEHGAYLSEETGDFFWVERPGVAIATHLQPDRWEASELVKLAEAVSEEQAQTDPVTEEVEAETEVVEEAAESKVEGSEGDDPAQAPAAEAPVEEAPAEETPAQEDAPADEAPAEEAPVDEAPADEVPAQEEAPVDEAPVNEEVDAGEVDAGEVDAVTPVEEVTEEAATPVEADAPDSVSTRETRACLTEHFLDFGSGRTELDAEQMTQTSGDFVERALAGNDLDDAERDRLLATVWYYGDENEKVAATNDCALQFGLERGVVEGVVTGVSDLIGQLAQEADESGARSTDGGENTSGETDEVTDPVGADEWAQLWESLPWTIPTESS